MKTKLFILTILLVVITYMHAGPVGFLAEDARNPLELRVVHGIALARRAEDVQERREVFAQDAHPSSKSEYIIG